MSLAGDLSSAYSRQINSQHRLVYQLHEDQCTVKVLRMWSHYERCLIQKKYKTIQKPTENAHAGGITPGQFTAGMQAARDSGNFGPAVSGGEKYLVYPDGSWDNMSSEAEANSK